LLSLVIPGHLIFMYTISYMKAGHTSITWTFATFYLTASMLQVFNIFSWEKNITIILDDTYIT
jgi:hypothetical protein